MSHVFGKGGVGGFLGRTFSAKNLIPEIATIAGGIIGGPVGAGLGNVAGNLVEGKSLGNALESGAISGAEDVALGGITGAIGKAAGGTGTGTLIGNLVNDITGGSSIVGNAINTAGADLGIGTAASAAAGAGTGTILGNAINNIASAVGLGGATGSVLGNAVNQAGAAVGLGGATPAAAAAPSTAQLIAHTGSAAADAALAPAAASGGGLGSLISDVGGDLGLSKSDILPGALLGYTMLKGQQQLPGQSQITQAAETAAQQAAQLEAPLTSGAPLPGGLSSGIMQAADAAKAQIQSNFASMGLSGSTQEATALAQVDQNAQIQTAQLAQQLYTEGANQAGVSTADYATTMQTVAQQDAAYQQALNNFAAALGGGTTKAA